MDELLDWRLDMMLLTVLKELKIQFVVLLAVIFWSKFFNTCEKKNRPLTLRYCILLIPGFCEYFK